MLRTFTAGLLALLMLLCAGCGSFGTAADSGPAVSMQGSLEAAASAPADLCKGEAVEISDSNSYCYALLEPQDQELYRQILATYQSAGADFSSPVFDQDKLIKIANYVLLDHPEIFWYTGDIRVTTHSRGDEVVGMELRFGYEVAPEDLEAATAAVKARAQECLSAIDPAWSDYDKIKAVYDWLIRFADYASAEKCQTLYSIMTKGRGVCTGYARSMQYLLQQLNIPCVLVSGTAGRENHAWNLVKADGEYYYLDATMGDPVATETAEPDPDYVSYGFFCITTDDLLRTHTPDDTISLPRCTATDCNYYVRNGLYFTEYDPLQVEEILAAAVEQGENAALRFADAKAFSEAYSRLFFQDEIFPMLRKIAGSTQSIDPTSVDYRKEGADDILVICPAFL